MGGVGRAAGVATCVEGVPLRAHAELTAANRPIDRATRNRVVLIFTKWNAAAEPPLPEIVVWPQVSWRDQLSQPCGVVPQERLYKTSLRGALDVQDTMRRGECNQQRTHGLAVSFSELLTETRRACAPSLPALS